MREILTDEISQIECQLFKPFPSNLLLNDLEKKQAELFQTNTKMNLFLKSKSGSRPESILAQALSSAPLLDTNIAISLALDMDTHGGVRSEDVVQAQQMQNNLNQERITSIEQGDSPADIIAREDRAEISRLKEKVTLEQSMVVNQMDARYDAEDDLEQQEAMTALMKEGKGNLRVVFEGLTGNSKSTYLNKRFGKDDIILGIKERRPDLDSKDILDAMGNFHVDNTLDDMVDEIAGEPKRHTPRTRKVGPARTTPDPFGDGLKRSGFSGSIAKLFGSDRDGEF